jgi:ribosomal protein L10
MNKIKSVEFDNLNNLILENPIIIFLKIKNMNAIENHKLRLYLKENKLILKKIKYSHIIHIFNKFNKVKDIFLKNISIGNNYLLFCKNNFKFMEVNNILQNNNIINKEILFIYAIKIQSQFITNAMYSLIFYNFNNNYNGKTFFFYKFFLLLNICILKLFFEKKIIKNLIKND